MSKILQKGESGFGILIESDSGYVSTDLNPMFINEAFELKPNEPVLVNCILQKWGVKNKNGRIYPKDVLVPQVEVYQQLVDTNSAAGECFTPDTKILTKDGWKLIKNLSESEAVLTLNRNTNKTEYQNISKKIYEEYSGSMYNIKSRNIDINITPNHRFILLDSNNKYIEVRASELFENIETNKFWGGKYKIIKRFNWIGEDNTFVFNELNIKSETFFAFMGIYLSEGCFLSDGTIQITQKKELVINKIDDLLIDTKLNYKKKFRKNGVCDFFIKNYELYLYLKKLGKSHEKYIPSNIKSGTSKSLKILLDWFLLGDGRNVNYIQKNGNSKNKKSVFSTSKKLIYDLNEIQCKIGKSGNITIDTKRQDRRIIDKNHVIINGKEEIVETERIIKRINSRPLYTLHFSKTEHIYLDKRMIKIKKFNHIGKIVCVKVANETIFVMRNGKSIWTLNSDHPDSSIISLQNISHMITKMWWGTGDQENVLFGELKIIVSQGFIKYGVVSVVGDKIVLYLQNKIRLGISSRGVGTLKEIQGENLVQNDFELIGFDLVSTPSTPGGFIFLKQKGDKTFGETYVNKNGIYLKEEDNKIITATNRFLL